jgi:hypothetical protein
MPYFPYFSLSLTFANSKGSGIFSTQVFMEKEDMEHLDLSWKAKRA